MNEITNPNYINRSYNSAITFLLKVKIKNMSNSGKQQCLTKFKSLFIFIHYLRVKFRSGYHSTVNTIESIFNFKKSFLEVFFKFRYFNSS